MKANEFIKMQGLAEARRVLHDARGCVGVKLWGRYEFSTEDLKRLVESHELVESFKCRRYSGLSNAKDHLLTLAHIEEHEQLNRLRLAIADVESCVEVFSGSN